MLLGKGILSPRKKIRRRVREKWFEGATPVCGISSSFLFSVEFVDRNVIDWWTYLQKVFHFSTSTKFLETKEQHAYLEVKNDR